MSRCRVRVAAGLSICCLLALVILRRPQTWCTEGANAVTDRPSIFATRKQEQDADMLYRRQQSLEYKALESALSPELWQIPVAVQFDAGVDLNQTTHRPRLIWDLFGCDAKLAFSSIATDVY